MPDQLSLGNLYSPSRATQQTLNTLMEIMQMQSGNKMRELTGKRMKLDLQTGDRKEAEAVRAEALKQEAMKVLASSGIPDTDPEAPLKRTKILRDFYSTRDPKIAMEIDESLRAMHKEELEAERTKAQTAESAARRKKLEEPAIFEGMPGAQFFQRPAPGQKPEKLFEIPNKPLRESNDVKVGETIRPDNVKITKWRRADGSTYIEEVGPTRPPNSNVFKQGMPQFVGTTQEGTPLSFQPVRGTAGTISPIQTAPGVGVIQSRTQTTAEEKASSDVEAAEQRIRNLQKLYKPDFVGPIAGRLANLSAALPGAENIPGMDISSQQAEFMAANTTLQNEIIKFITGAQMSEPEARRIKRQIPDINDKPVMWEAKYKITLQNIDVMKEKMKKMGFGFRGAASDLSPEKRQARIAELREKKRRAEEAAAQGNK